MTEDAYIEFGGVNLRVQTVEAKVAAFKGTIGEEGKVRESFTAVREIWLTEEILSTRKPFIYVCTLKFELGFTLLGFVRRGDPIVNETLSPALIELLKFEIRIWFEVTVQVL